MWTCGSVTQEGWSGRRVRCTSLKTPDLLMHKSSCPPTPVLYGSVEAKSGGAECVSVHSLSAERGGSGLGIRENVSHPICIGLDVTFDGVVWIV